MLLHKAIWLCWHGICIVLLSVHVQYAPVTLLRCMYVCKMYPTTFALNVLLYGTLISSCCISVHDCSGMWPNAFIKCSFDINVWSYFLVICHCVWMKYIHKKHKEIRFASINIKGTFYVYNLNVKGKESPKTKIENTRLSFLSPPQKWTGPLIEHLLTLHNN